MFTNQQFRNIGIRPPAEDPGRKNVTGLDANNVWAAGRPGTILKWDGTTWSKVVSGTKHYYGVWAGDANNVWAAGGDGTVTVNLAPSICVQCGAITAKGGRLTPPEGGSGPEYTLS